MKSVIISQFLNLSKPKLKNLIKEISYFTEENLEKINNELFSINWENLILGINNIDKIYILYNKFIEIVDNSKSLKKILIKNNEYAKSIRKLISKRRKISKLYKIYSQKSFTQNTSN
jgi:hypothetical protein